MIFINNARTHTYLHLPARPSAINSLASSSGSPTVLVSFFLPITSVRFALLCLDVFSSNYFLLNSNLILPLLRLLTLDVVLNP